jgi:uridine kinase
MTVPFVVGIAGGSGAGKTALARIIAADLGLERVAELVHDAYYHDSGGLHPVPRASLDFNVPDALDQELFRAHLVALRRGQTIVPPRYCFATRRRLGAGEPVAPRDVLLVEGIVLLHDCEVRNLLDLRIYVDAPADLRLTRRITRDCAERGWTPQAVVAQCRATVFPAHLSYVELTKACADLVLVNAGRLEAVAEVAAAVIRTRLRAAHRQAKGARAA